MNYFYITLGIYYTLVAVLVVVFLRLNSVRLDKLNRLTDTKFVAKTGYRVRQLVTFTPRSPVIAAQLMGLRDLHRIQTMHSDLRYKLQPSFLRIFGTACIFDTVIPFTFVYVSASCELAGFSTTVLLLVVANIFLMGALRALSPVFLRPRMSRMLETLRALDTLRAVYFPEDGRV